MQVFGSTKRDIAGLHVMLGVSLFLSPWILGFVEADDAALSAWSMGAAAFAIGWSALKQPAWAFGGNLVVGLWMMMAPWVVDFTSEPAALWSHLVIGVVLGATAAVGMTEDSGPGPTVAA